MSDTRYVMFSRYWTDLIATGLLPLIALVALNYGIYVKIRKSVKFRENNDDKAGKRGSADTTMSIGLGNVARRHNTDKKGANKYEGVYSEGKGRRVSKRLATLCLRR